MTKEERLIIDDELEEISGGTDHKIDGKTPIGKLIVLKENIYFTLALSGLKSGYS